VRYGLFVAVLLLSGCSTNPGLISEAGQLSGKLTTADGKQVSNVGLTLQPLESGHPVTFDVKDDGSFSGDVVPGKYAYFVGKSSLKNSDQAIKKVDKKFLEPDMSRTVTVAPGREVSIVLQ
jgi:hypothetical protein